jgi:hypothetical protein
MPTNASTRSCEDSRHDDQQRYLQPKPAAAGLTATASPSAQAVANTTASIMPVAIATALSVRITQPSSGSSTNLTHSFPDRTAS